MNESVDKIAVGFKGASQLIGLSPRFLDIASKDPDPAKRLRTVRIARRRLIRVDDLLDWFNRVARDESGEQSQAA